MTAPERVVIGTPTFYEKAYALKRWRDAMGSLRVPADLEEVARVIVNTTWGNHPFNYKLERLMNRRASVERLPLDNARVDSRHVIAQGWGRIRERAIEEGAHLFCVEADNMPPPHALEVAWTTMKDTGAGVVGCLTGYPKVEGDDGTQHGFRSWMIGNIRKEDEMTYREVQSIDTEANERQRPRVMRKGDRLRVANREGRTWWEGADGEQAEVERQLAKADREHVPPVRTCKVPLVAPHYPVPVDLEKPAHVDALHFGCTLIRADILQRFPFRAGDFLTQHCDLTFFKDLKEAGVPVFSAPVVVPHWHRPWSARVRW